MNPLETSRSAAPGGGPTHASVAQRGESPPTLEAQGRRKQERRVTIALQGLILAAVPAVLIGNMLWLLISPSFVRAQYALSGIPARVEGLGDKDARSLGASGARAIHPGGDGFEVLERARLEDGRPAFFEREIRHMEDVHSVVNRFLLAWAAALLAVTASILTLWRRGRADAAARALARGAEVTLAGALLVGLGLAMSFGAVFAAFHGVLFAPGSWRFPAGSLLLKLYPETFWAVAGASAAVLTVLQAVGLRILMRRSTRAPRHAPAPAGSRDGAR